VVYTGKINAYNQTLSTDIIETFTLFGDPATVLKISSSTNTTTTTPGGTTTTSISPTPCFAKSIYGENSEETELLRKYRDNVLSKTPEGQES